MEKTTKKINIPMRAVLFGALVVAFLFSNTTPAHAEVTSCLSKTGGYCFELAQVAGKSYPGVEFLGKDIKGPADLLQRLYAFGLIAAALSAFLMITVGGFMYLTAADNPGRATEGRKRITNAIFGLSLALLSYLILNTLSPTLVKGWNVEIKPIDLARGGPGLGGGGGGGAQKFRCHTAGMFGVGKKCYGPEFEKPDCGNICLSGSTCIPVRQCP